MAEKRVIEYEAASELANDDWLLIDGVTEGTRKARPSTVTAELGQQVTNLATTVSGLTQVAMGHEQSFAPSYDESASYDVGDLVMKYACLYKCTAPTTGTWDSSKWQLATVAEQLEESGKIDDVQVNGVSVVTDKVASIDLTDMQDDIDSKQADTKIGGASILDNNKVANLDFLASYGEASGEIASFNDGAAMPLKSLKVGIEAVQDLHGYDSPWVGGSGKNKFDESNFNDDTSWQYYTLTLNPNTTYTASSNNGNYYEDNTFPQLYVYATGSGAGSNNAVYTGHSVNITTGSDGVLKVQWKTNNNSKKMTSYHLQVEQGSTATSYAPYSNIRPISGWSAVNVYDTGKNFIPITCETQTKQGVDYTVYKNEDGAVIRIHAEGTATANHSFSFVEGYNASNPFMIKAGSYWFKGLSDGVSGQYDFNIRKKKESSDIVQKTDKVSLELSEDTYFQSCYLYVYSGTTINTDIYPMVWLKSEPNDDFEAYNGTTYTTQLKDGQGNPMECYGGELSNVNGVQRLTLTHGYIASYNGEALPSTWISDRDVYAEGTTPTTGAEVVYELATPIEYDLADVSISTQDGTNNIWADTGDIAECKYVRDNSAVINDLIARVTALENE